MPKLSHYMILAVLIGNSLGAIGQAGNTRATLHENSGVPTPVSGDSWLTHLNRPFNDTSMGKTGELGPASDDMEPTPATLDVALPTSATALSGADLYRMNCRGCHGAEGLGAPPEINSVINPVRATSAPLVIERMKSRGLDISPAAANELAGEAREALLKRLHQGGDKMPSFSYLTEPEIASILAYLKQLADMPGAAREQKTISESPGRVGELIVKSTCHICHDGAGPNPTREQLLQGAIPPLQTLTSRVNQAKFIRKVTHGSPIVMGEVPMLYRGRMPVFYYLTPQEAADAYLYLNYYPPVEKAREVHAVALSEASGMPPGDGSSSGGGALDHSNSERETKDAGFSQSTIVLFAALFCAVFALVAGGLAFTIREFSRMSPPNPPLRASSESPVKVECQRTTSVSRAVSRYSISEPAHTISH